MTSNGRRSFRLRIAGVLALLVALNGLFVAALVWAYGTVIPGVVAWALLALFGEQPTIDFLDLAVSPLALAVLTAAFLVAQAWYGYTRLLSDVWEGTASPEDAPDLHAAVTRLAAQADVSAPSVAVVDAEHPNCFTVGRAGNATIVVTRPLLAALDPDERDAVLAHEIAHVKNRDVTLMTLASLFIAIAERAYRATSLLRRAQWFDREGMSRRASLALDWLLPVVIVSYLFVAPILWLFPPLARLANETLSRQREFAADDAAAAITGRPLALAGALTTLYEYEPPQPDEDLRRSAEGLRALCFVPFGGVRDVERGPGADADASDAEVPDADTPDADAPDADVPSADAPPEPDAEAERDAAAASADTSAESAARARRIDDWLADRPAAPASTAGTHPPVEERVERLVERSAVDP